MSGEEEHEQEFLARQTRVTLQIARKIFLESVGGKLRRRRGMVEGRGMERGKGKGKDGEKGKGEGWRGGGRGGMERKGKGGWREGGRGRDGEKWEGGGKEDGKREVSLMFAV